MTKRLLNHDEDTRITTWFEHDPVTRKNIITKTQDVTDILDTNVKIQNESNGWSKSKFLRHVASVPIMTLYQWMSEEGWDPFDPNNKDKLNQKFNDIEYRKLRTSLWRV